MIKQMPVSVLKINTLGVFSVSVNNEKISDNSSRSGQIWKLFKFIITNKATPISTEKLIDMLWPDENCDNPIKALYSLVFRLRSILRAKFSDNPEFFTFHHNSYIWNDNAPYWLDTENFVFLCKEADDVSLPPEKRISLFQSAFDLYKGDYLAESGQEAWVLPYTNYYKRLFSAAIAAYAKICESAGDYKNIIKYCEKAIAMDLYDEANHVTLIETLLNIGQFSQAMAHYNYIAAVLRKDLGVQPSERLQELNRQIHKQLEDVQYDIKMIQGSLSENDFMSGAYYCDIDVFREIYRLEKRAMERSGLSAYLVLISLVGSNNSALPAADLSVALAMLKKITLFGLRRGDVVAQYSKSQLLLLLPGNSYETCETVMERLEESFMKARHALDVKLIVSIQHIQK